jgi:hypothetical protein
MPYALPYALLCALHRHHSGATRQPPTLGSHHRLAAKRLPLDIIACFSWKYCCYLQTCRLSSSSITMENVCLGRRQFYPMPLSLLVLALFNLTLCYQLTLAEPASFSWCQQRTSSKQKYWNKNLERKSKEQSSSLTNTMSTLKLSSRTTRWVKGVC